MKKAAFSVSLQLTEGEGKKPPDNKKHAENDAVFKEKHAGD